MLKTALSLRCRFMTSTALRLVLVVAFTVVEASVAVARAASFQVLYNFGGVNTDGDHPETGLLKDKAGNLYGTTSFGGPGGAGTVFRLTPTGTETTLLSFTNKSDGGYPFAALIQDKAGNLYGTTYEGGVSNDGVVFKLAPDGTETILHAFNGQDGQYLYGGVTIDGKGNLFGTTFQGGTGGKGVVFKIAPDKTFTVLHNFSGTDGAGSKAGLVKDAAGNLYGTTQQGGGSGAGTVFKLAPDRTLTMLHSFTQQSDGGFPTAAPILDVAGNLYGTTSAGGAGTNAGVVYKVTPTGTLTVLHTFLGDPVDGGVPVAGLIADGQGNLYGTTSAGSKGSSVRAGTVFKLAPDGTETILHSFNGGKGGSYPAGSLITDPADQTGYFYSTTVGGGTYKLGVIFKIHR